MGFNLTKKKKISILKRTSMSTCELSIEVFHRNSLKRGSRFVGRQHDEWLLNLLTDDQETVEAAPRETWKSWDLHLVARNVSFVETSATFNVIVLSLCYKKRSPFNTWDLSGLIRGASICWCSNLGLNRRCSLTAVSNESLGGGMRELHPVHIMCLMVVLAAYVRFLIHLTWPETLSAAEAQSLGEK